MMQHEQNNEESEFKFCKTFNCIYMLTCGVCGFKYIGQTSGAMNLRINQHRSDIGKNTSTKNIGRIEIQHFNKHGFEDVALNIIKIVPNKINRLWYENVYIGIYNAMYPYGLNVIWNNKNLIQAVKQNDKESIYNSRNNSNKRKRVDESRFCLQHQDGRTRVRWHRGECTLTACFHHHHTGPSTGMMVWGAFGCTSQSPLVRINGNFE
ncbi:hypothetical protein TNCV_4109301 [Trichonephila clavipes]|nr:hypothetical protein TNCV_4109301 [Trichonephila clavipes]